MRIWLDPNKLNSYQLTTQDVVSAIQSQNAQVAVGQLGGTPSVDKQALNATITPSRSFRRRNSSAKSPCGSIRTVRW